MATDKPTTKLTPGMRLPPSLAEAEKVVDAFHEKLSADETWTEERMFMLGRSTSAVEEAREDFVALAKEMRFKGSEQTLLRALSFYADWVRRPF